MSGSNHAAPQIGPAATPAEAAAIVAALERFMRATAAPPPSPGAAPDAWRRTTMLEAVEREPDRAPSHPWMHTSFFSQS